MQARQLLLLPQHKALNDWLLCQGEALLYLCCLLLLLCSGWFVCNHCRFAEARSFLNASTIILLEQKAQE